MTKNIFTPEITTLDIDEFSKSVSTYCEGCCEIHQNVGKKFYRTSQTDKDFKKLKSELETELKGLLDTIREKCDFDVDDYFFGMETINMIYKSVIDQCDKMITK